MSQLAISVPETLREGRYVVGELLGQGGMAVVVKAHDTELGVDWAVKILAPHGAHRKSLRRRLKAEARAMARLNHPNILAIHDVGTEDDLDYVVMDLALGGSLQDVAERGPMDPWVATSFMVQVLSALGAAHAQGIVHRDVKPHNVLLDLNGRAMLADFGIALLAGEDRRTRTGVAMGSLAYMPPEQRLDAARVGPTADLYAVGSSLYAMITRNNPVDLFLAGPKSERWAGVPDALRPLLQKAVRMAPEERWQDATTFAHALMEAIRGAGMDLPSIHGMMGSFVAADRTAAPTGGPAPTRDPTQAALEYLDQRVPTVAAVDLPPLE
ncbi:MAG: serine/threonine protein kinase, partial [Myxococcales bacterium]|nr:serine/threonine protein kinase [Myxococcales bacterium]